MIGESKTHEQYVAEVAIKNPNIEVVGRYINSKTKILHKCKIDGHEWMQRPDKILGGRGCPMCSGYVVLPQIRSLTATHPEIAKEWDYEKNGDLKPTAISYGSDKEVWWVCEYGHSYKRRVSDRTICGRHCSKCSKLRHSSESELKVYYYIKKYFSDAIIGYEDRSNNLTEIDIYIPSLKIGFEYDGSYWHQNIYRDVIKDLICKNIGIKLIRIREPKCPQYVSNCGFIYLKDLSQKTLEIFIGYILEALGIENPIVDFNKDSENINNLINQCRKNEFTKKHIRWRQAKEVYCPELSQLFISLNEAERNTKVPSSRISNCCKGIVKSAGKHPITGEKLHWYYLYDQPQKDGSVIQGAITLGLITEEDISNLFTSE